MTDAVSPEVNLCSKKKPPKWRSQRGYRHFDCPQYVNNPPNPDAVAKHGFFPFIGKTVVSRRLKRERSKVVKKRRQLRYASHRDSSIFAYYSELLAQRYEAEVVRRGLSENVLAYRKFPGKTCNIHHAKSVFDFIYNVGDCEVITTDVEEFFERLRHDLIKAKWQELTQVERLPADHFAVFKHLCNYRWVELDDLRNALSLSKRSFRRESVPGRSRHAFANIALTRDILKKDGLVKANQNNHGIPQGSPISALVSNIYMLDFDSALADFASSNGGVYRRYSDDILLMTRVGAIENARDLLVSELEKIGLSLHPHKTTQHRFAKELDLVRTDTPIQYLGFEFNGHTTRIRNRTLSTYFQRMKRAVRRAYKAAKSSGESRINRQRLFEKYSHLGNRNFISYARRSIQLFYPGITSNPMKKQIKNHWSILQMQIAQAEARLSQNIKDASS